MSFKGTFFDSFTPASVKTDEEKEQEKTAAAADGSDVVEDDVAQLAATAEYGDESKFEELDDKTGEPIEEEEEEGKPEVKTPLTDGDDVEDLEEGSYEEFIKALADEDVVYMDPNKQYSKGTDGVIEVIEDTVSKKIKDWEAEIPEDYASVIAALKAGKPLAEWIEVKNPENLADADLEDLDTQRALVERQMRAQEFDEDEIEVKLEKLEDAGMLQDEAKSAQKYLLKQQKKQEKEYEARLAREVEEQEEREELAKENLKKSILDVKELGGFKLDKKRQTQLFEHITKPVGKTGKTQLQLNQTDFNKQLLAAYLDMIDYDFKDVEKVATTKVSKGLRTALSNLTTDPNARRSGRSVTEPKQSLRVPKGIWDSPREVED